MREILFRGKTILGDWVSGYLSIPTKKLKGYGSPEAGHAYISNQAGCPFAYEVRPETVGQYTGLKDKNGTKIFEGDKVWWGWGNHGGLGWEHSGTVVVDINNYDDLHMLVEQHELEVIGNIHDSPEMLESSPC